MPTLYRLARAGLFRLPAETAHEVVIRTLGVTPAPVRQLLRRTFAVEDPRLHSRIWGIDFPNPVGLAAGLDKGGSAFNALAAMGFGFVEIGTITAEAQPGNARPRVFRLPADRALLNRMGFNNPGAEAVARRLATTPAETILGINVGKSRVTPLERAVEDYLRSIELLEGYARYLVVNVSSPNTPGLRELQDAGPLRALLEAVVRRRSAAGVAGSPPVLVKLAPDLTDPQLDQAVDIAMEAGVAGIVAVNTTISREHLRTPRSEVDALGPGGISGAPVRARANEVVGRVFERTRGSVPIIGVGGIFDARDAWDRICAGARLIQVYTGLVYRGPGLVAEINRGIVERLAAVGLSSITEAVGRSAR